MARQYRSYSDENIINYSKEVFCLSELLLKLGLKQAGGNYGTIKEKLQTLKIDISHWKKSSWNKDKQLKDWKEYKKRGSYKKILLRKNGHKCQNCNLTDWCGSKIPLELDHIDGDSTNNSEENLRLVCCNCHAMTDTWRGRNAKIEKINQPKLKSTIEKQCAYCGNNFQPKHKRYKYCSINCCNKHKPKIKPQQTKINWPETKILLESVKINGFENLAKSMGISSNAIRKRIKNHPA